MATPGPTHNAPGGQPPPAGKPGGASCAPGSSCEKCTVCKIAWILVLVGGVNWGLVGLGGFLGKDLNAVNMLLGSWPAVEWIVYILVGVAAIMKAAKCCKCCKKK